MGIATNSLRTYMFRIITGITGFLIGVLISRNLGPTGKGVYSALFLFYSIYVPIAGMLGTAVIYQITRLRQSPKTVLVTASLYSFTLGLLTILLFWLYTLLTRNHQTGPVWFLVAIIPCTLILTNLSGVFQGLNRITTLNWIGASQGILQLILLTTGFLGFRMNVNGAVAIWFISQLIAFLAALWLGREFWWPPVRQDFSWPLLTAMLGFGWQIALTSAVSILNTNIDSLMVLTYRHTKEYGLYSVAINGASILWYTSTSIAIAISARVGMAEREQAGRLTVRAARHTLLINLPFAVIMWVAAWLIPLVYSQRFAAAMLPFRILLPGILAYSVAGIFSTYFTNHLGKPKISLLVAFISLLIDLGGCLIFIPKMGMIGGAVANTLSYVISISVLIALFCKEAKMSIFELFTITKDDLADYKLLLTNIGNVFFHKTRG